MGRYVAARDALRREGVTASDVRTVVALAEPSLGFYASLVALSVFVPRVAAFGLLAVAAVTVVLPPRLVSRRLRRVT